MSSNQDRRDRLEAYRNRVRQARRLEQILRRRRAYKRVSLAPVSSVGDETWSRDLWRDGAPGIARRRANAPSASVEIDEQAAAPTARLQPQVDQRQSAAPDRVSGASPC
jgi:hypothetical protein